jgi:hypothetical protein
LLKAKKWSDEDNDKMIKIAKEFISWSSYFDIVINSKIQKYFILIFIHFNFTRKKQKKSISPYAILVQHQFQLISNHKNPIFTPIITNYSQNSNQVKISKSKNTNFRNIQFDPILILYNPHTWQLITHSHLITHEPRLTKKNSLPPKQTHKNHFFCKNSTIPLT